MNYDLIADFRISLLILSIFTVLKLGSGPIFFDMIFFPKFILFSIVLVDKLDCFFSIGTLFLFFAKEVLEALEIVCLVTCL